MRRGYLKLFFLLCCFAGGCEPSCEELEEGSPSVQIGTSSGSQDSDFVPLSDGDSISPAWGPQGGQHLWSALQTTDLRRGAAHGTHEAAMLTRPEVRFSLHSGDDVIAQFHRTNQALRHLPAQVGEALNLTSILFLSPYEHEHFFPEDFDPDGWQEWEEGELQNAWEHANDIVQSMDWTFELTVIDTCGTEVRDSRLVRIDGELNDNGY